MQEINRARLALWNNLLKVPHRDLTGPVGEFSKALVDDPDFVGRAMYALTLPRFNRIRDLAEAGLAVLLSAPAEFQRLRRVGGYLLGRVPPYQLIRIDDYLDLHTKGHPKRHTRKAVMTYLDDLNVNLSRLEGALGKPGNRAGLRRLSIRYHYTHAKNKNYGYIQMLVHEGVVPDNSQAGLIKRIAALDDPLEQAKLAADSGLSEQVLSSILILHPATVAVRIQAMSASEAVNARGWLEEGGYLDNKDLLTLWSSRVESGPVSASTIEQRKSAKRGQNTAVNRVLAEAKDKAAKSDRITSPPLIIVDISSSMEKAIEVAKRFGERILSRCDGEPLALACNTSARKVNLADMSMIRANGGTSLGCGLVYAQRVKFNSDRVVVITDDCERDAPYYVNQKDFADREHVFIIVPSNDIVQDRASYKCEAAGWKVQRFMTRNDDKDYAALDQVTAILASPPGRTIVDEILELEFPVV